MRRPAPRSATDIAHPGPRAKERRPHAFGTAVALDVRLAPGDDLTEALARAAKAADASSAVFDLGGLALSKFDYVMPASAIDDRHVAWYSDTHHAEAARLDRGVAVLGHRGDWFLHVHADWTDGGGHRSVGHLLPDTLCVTEPCRVTGWGIRGAAFVAREDPETEFTLFRVASDAPGAGNALIATLAPDEDLSEAVTVLAEALGGRVHVAGLGSFCGAAFEQGPVMACPVSEVLLCPGAWAEAGRAHLPTTCVDLTGALFEGAVLPGRAPTLVTFELLLVRMS